MNVLSIDLDFIAEPYIQLYHRLCNEQLVDLQWDTVFNDPAIIGSNFDINPSNLVYALDIFSRGLAKCKNVVFGITHDSILFELEDKDKQVAWSECAGQVQPLFSLWSLKTLPIVEQAIENELFGPKPIMSTVESVLVNFEKTDRRYFLNINNKETLQIAKNFIES